MTLPVATEKSRGTFSDDWKESESHNVLVNRCCRPTKFTLSNIAAAYLWMLMIAMQCYPLEKSHDLYLHQSNNQILSRHQVSRAVMCPLLMHGHITARDSKLLIFTGDNGQNKQTANIAAILTSLHINTLELRQNCRRWPDGNDKYFFFYMNTHYLMSNKIWLKCLT